MQQGHMNKVCERGRECETEKIKVGLRQQTMNYYFNTTLQEKWPMLTDSFFLQTWISVGKSQKYFYLQLTNVGKTQPLYQSLFDVDKSTV